MLNLEELFEKHQDEYLKFDKVIGKVGNRADLNAFILLDHICQNNYDIVEDSDHDIIYLGIDCDELAEKATEEQIITLIGCGVLYDADHAALTMFT